MGPIRTPTGQTTLIYDRRLTKITYPTGGYTRYQWGMSGDLTQTVLQSRCINDGGGEKCTQYKESPRDVVTPEGGWTRHSFDFEGRETRVEHRTGTWPNGTLLRTEDKVWDASKGSPLLTRVTVTLNDTNQKSKTEYDYDRRAPGAAQHVRCRDLADSSEMTPMKRLDHGQPAIVLG